MKKGNVVQKDLVNLNSDIKSLIKLAKGKTLDPTSDYFLRNILRDRWKSMSASQKKRLAKEVKVKLDEINYKGSEARLNPAMIGYAVQAAWDVTLEVLSKK